MKLSKHIVILFFIFIVALLIRTVSLETLPLGFHRDEVMNGYVGRYILENGEDLYGNTWPILYFDNFGDYPNVVPMYVSGLSTLILGNTKFAVRFPIALFGALTVFPLYGLIVHLFKKRWLGLVGAGFLAITPWHIVLSRATAEGITAGFVFMSALWLVITGLKSGKMWKSVLAIGLFALTYLLYPSYRIFIPMVWVFLPFLAPTRKTKLSLAIITVLFFALTFGISQTDWGRGRFEQTSVFASNQTVDAMTQRFVFGSGSDPVWLTRIFHNKAVVGSREILNQYTSYFSGDFLLGRGGLPMRYHIPDNGLLFYAVVILLLLLLVPRDIVKRLGVTVAEDGVLKQSTRHVFAFMILLLLLAPLPSALTRDDVPNVHRSALMSILYIFPVVYAFAVVSGWRVKKLWNVSVVIFIVILACIELVYFTRMYTTHADAFQAIHRHDDINQVIGIVLDEENNFDRVLLPEHQQMALQYLFAKGDYSAEYAGQFEENIYIKQIGNIEFYRSDCPTEVAKLPDIDSNENVLVFNRSECVDDMGLSVREKITDVSSIETYRVLTN